MSNFREIVTKAVIGKAKKTSGDVFEITPEEVPDTVLGCWVINHSFNGTNNGGSVKIVGSFDVNVWYSYDNDTKTTVTTRRFNYTDKMNVKLLDDKTIDSTEEIIVRSLRQPNVVNVSIKDGVVKLEIEKELGVEVVGNTKVKVNVEEDFDDYEEVLDDEIEEEIESVKEDYLEDKESQQ